MYKTIREAAKNTKCNSSSQNVEDFIQINGKGRIIVVNLFTWPQSVVQQIPLVMSAILSSKNYLISGMTLHPGYFSMHPVTNGTKQKRTLHPGWPYICGPYKWGILYPIITSILYFRTPWARCRASSRAGSTTWSSWTLPRWWTPSRSRTLGTRWQTWAESHQINLNCTGRPWWSATKVCNFVDFIYFKVPQCRPSALQFRPNLQLPKQIWVDRTVEKKCSQQTLVVDQHGHPVDCKTQNHCVIWIVTFSGCVLSLLEEQEVPLLRRVTRQAQRADRRQRGPAHR